MAKKRPAAKKKIAVKSKPSPAMTRKPAPKKSAVKTPAPAAKKKPAKSAAKPVTRGKAVAAKMTPKKIAPKTSAPKKKMTKPVQRPAKVQPKQSVKPAAKKPAPTPKHKANAKVKFPPKTDAPPLLVEEVIIVSESPIDVAVVAAPMEMIVEDFVKEEIESRLAETTAEPVELAGEGVEEPSDEDLLEETEPPISD
ncbi:MAG TPA: hypothetical protein VG326_00665 [Tepidisphaeraceae bacterium]|jgi:hypothetical protein|nr:hypothetical protein [Tepidisphaeraceae bacterium]